jgi:hypothetical protein
MSPAHKYLKDAWNKKVDEAGGVQTRRRRTRPQTEERTVGWGSGSENQTLQSTQPMRTAKKAQAEPAATRVAAGLKTQVDLDEAEVMHRIFNTAPRKLTDAQRRALLRLPKYTQDFEDVDKALSHEELSTTQKKINEDARQNGLRARQELAQSRKARADFYKPTQKMATLLPEHVLMSTIRANQLLQCPFDTAVTDLTGFKSHKCISGMQGACNPLPLAESVGERGISALISHDELNAHVNKIQERQRFLDAGALEHIRKVTAAEMSDLPEHQYQVFSRQFGLTQPYKIDELTGRSKHPIPGMQGSMSPIPTAPFSEGYVPREHQEWRQTSKTLGSQNSRASRRDPLSDTKFRRTADQQSWTTSRR